MRVRSAAFFTLLLSVMIGEAAAQCASRGGPGFRLPTGRCASWDQHESYMRRGGYPPGTADERSPRFPGASNPPRPFQLDPSRPSLQWQGRERPAAPP